jgi:murein L,D-transpeptidase YafK
MNKSYVRSIIYILIFISALLTCKFGRSLWVPIQQKVHGKRTVADVIQKYGKLSRARLMPHFLMAKVNYPPQEITLIALKKEKVLELWASDGDEYNFVCQYKIIKTSGKAGPQIERR